MKTCPIKIFRECIAGLFSSMDEILDTTATYAQASERSGRDLIEDLDSHVLIADSPVTLVKDQLRS